MKPTDADRDLAFDRLIARGLVEETDVKGNACPDADLLAAWFDRSLSASEIERIETHASGCASCQQVLADLARSEPPVVRAAPEPAPARPWHWHWRWLVPAATVVVVVLVVGNRTLRAPSPIGGPESAQLTEQAAAKEGASQQAASQAASPETAPAGRAGGLASVEKNVVAPQQASKKETSRDNVAASPKRAAPPAAPPPAIDQVAPFQADAGARIAQNKPADQPRQAASNPGIVAGVGGAAPPSKAATADTVGRVEESVAVAVPRPLAPPAPMSLRTAMKGDRVPWIVAVAVSPSGKVAWRVGAGGSIDRSSDAGRTWQSQMSGITTNLSAASAWSDSACWAVGADGVILRTGDGVTWERLNSPAASDFVSVRASSQDAATVKAADGSQYATTDGGRTWKKTE